MLTSQPLPAMRRPRNGEGPYQIRGFSLVAVVVICHLINMYANHGVIVTSSVCIACVAWMKRVHIPGSFDRERERERKYVAEMKIRGGDLRLSISRRDARSATAYLLTHSLQNKQSAPFVC